MKNPFRELGLMISAFLEIVMALCYHISFNECNSSMFRARATIENAEIMSSVFWGM